MFSEHSSNYSEFSPPLYSPPLTQRESAHQAELKQRVANIAERVLENERKCLGAKRDLSRRFQCDSRIIAPLLDNNKISEKRLESAVYEAALQGDYEIAFLLSKESAAFSQAGFDGLRLFLNNSNATVTFSLSRLIFVAVQNGFPEIVNFLLSEGRAISSNDLGYAVSVAASKGRTDIVKILLSEGRAISPDRLSSIVLDAAKDGHIDIVRFLLSEGKIISEKDLSSAVKNAAENDHFNIVGFLLSEGRAISEDDLGSAVKSAAGNGHINRVKWLLSKGRTISEDDMGSAVKSAAGNGHINMVKWLLSEGRAISEDDLGSAVEYAAENGHIDIVKWLLSEGRTISEDDLGSAVEYAARNGHIDIVGFLLSEGRTISSNGLSCAVRGAARNDHIDIVRFLLSEDRTLTPEKLSISVLQAVETGSVSTVEFLLQQGPINATIRDSAITNASGADRESIRNMLHNARVYNENAHQQPHVAADDNPFTLNLKDVEHSPTIYLQTLFKYGLPSRVTLLNDEGSRAPAVDLGGVTKQFIASLCEALKTKRSFLITNEGILGAATKQQEQICEQLGRLVSLIFTANGSKTDPILTGYLFSEHFLQIVKDIATASEEEKGFKQVCARLKTITPPYLHPTIDFVLEPTIGHKKAYLINEGEEEEAALFPDDPALAAAADDAALAAARGTLQLYYQAAKSFLEGTTESFKSALKTKNLSALCRSFQGDPVSAQGVLHSLRLVEGEISQKSRDIIQRVTTGEPTETQRWQKDLRHQLCETHGHNEALDIISAAFLDKVDWLVEVIASKDISQKEDRVWLEKFVFAITGKKALSSNMTLRLQPSWRSGGLIFEMHTCYNGLDLPTVAVSHRSFIAALEGAIDIADYTIA